MSNIPTSQAANSHFHVHKFHPVLASIAGLALLGASQVQAAPSAIGAAHAVTRMDRANYYSTLNCGNALVMTPQPGTDLVPVEVAAPEDVEAFYSQAARQQVTWLDAVECEEQAEVYAPALIANTTDSSYVGNWSGYQIGGNTAASNRFVQSGWHVPTVTVPNLRNAFDGSYHVAVWVGLGGGINSNYSPARPIIQAGTRQTINVNGSSDAYFWYQIYPLPAQRISKIPVRPGDWVGAVVFWVPASNTAVLGVCNWNTSTCINFNVPNVSEPSNTTEWIVEAPSVDNIVQQLANFQPYVDFDNGCWAASTTFTTSGKPDTLYATGGANGITGSATCSPISAGPSLFPIEMRHPSLGEHKIAIPTSIGSNGSAFRVDYNPIK